jgi:hypothetical protein
MKIRGALSAVFFSAASLATHAEDFTQLPGPNVAESLENLESIRSYAEVIGDKFDMHETVSELKRAGKVNKALDLGLTGVEFALADDKRKFASNAVYDQIADVSVAGGCAVGSALGAIWTPEKGARSNCLTGADIGERLAYGTKRLADRAIDRKFGPRKSVLGQRADSVGFDLVEYANNYDGRVGSSQFNADAAHEVLKRQRRREIFSGRPNYTPDEQLYSYWQSQIQAAESEEKEFEKIKNSLQTFSTDKDCVEVNDQWNFLEEEVRNEACRLWYVNLQGCEIGPNGSVPIPWSIVEGFREDGAMESFNNSTATNNRYLAIFDLPPEACATNLVEESWDLNPLWPWHESLRIDLEAAQ